jgi:hypothetical protein
MKTLVFASLLTSTLPGFACSYITIDSPEIKSVVKANGGYKVTEEQCVFLNKHKLALRITGDATVLKGVSIAWSEVNLSDPDGGITSSNSQSSTQVNASVASQDFANKMLYQAVNEAIAGYDYETGAGEVDRFRGKSKQGR